MSRTERPSHSINREALRKAISDASFLLAGDESPVVYVVDAMRAYDAIEAFRWAEQHPQDWERPVVKQTAIVRDYPPDSQP